METRKKERSRHSLGFQPANRADREDAGSAIHRHHSGRAQPVHRGLALNKKCGWQGCLACGGELRPQTQRRPELEQPDEANRCRVSIMNETGCQHCNVPAGEPCHTTNMGPMITEPRTYNHVKFPRYQPNNTEHTMRALNDHLLRDLSGMGGQYLPMRDMWNTEVNLGILAQEMYRRLRTSSSLPNSRPRHGAKPVRFSRSLASIDLRRVVSQALDGKR